MTVKAGASISLNSVKDINDTAANARDDIAEQRDYFWHDSIGAHILSDTNEVTGVRYRTDLKGGGQEIIEIDGSSETSVAKFGADGARLGESAGAHSVIDEDGQRFYAVDGTTQLANIGYAEGTAETGTDTTPFYTFGTRTGNTVGNYSVAEGRAENVSGAFAHAEGGNHTVSGNFAHAEGGYNTVSNNVAHAEGWHNTASGNGAHVEGYNCTAQRQDDHAEGYHCVAKGTESHAQNYYTIAQAMAQTAIGAYNIAQGTPGSIGAGDLLFIIGNGTGTYARSDAFTVDWSGNTWAAGDITDGSGNVLSGKANKVSARTASNSEAHTMTNSHAKVELSNKAYCGSNTSMSSGTNSGGIKCDVAGTVSVSCAARIVSLNDQDLCQVAIYKGTTSQYMQASRAGGNTLSVAIPEVLISVSAGDIIHLHTYNGTAARGSIPANSAFLTVEYIEEE